MRYSIRLLVPALLAGCAALPGAPTAAEPPSGAAGSLFVANKRGASLSKIDLASGEELRRAETCDDPHELTVSPDGAHVLVACYSGTSVEVFRTSDLAPAFTLELGENARVHSAVWHASGKIVAGAEGRGSLFVIGEQRAPEPADLVEIGGGGPGPHMVAVNDAGTIAWGTIIPTGTIVRYDLERAAETGRRVLGGQTEALALSPDGKTVWVGSNAGDKVWRLDAETLETHAEIEVGKTPIRIAAHPGGRFLATSNLGSGDISIIDAATDAVVRTIPVSRGEPRAQVTLIFSPDGARLYAAETQTDTIAEIDFATGEVVRRLSGGAGGDGLAVTD